MSSPVSPELGGRAVTGELEFLLARPEEKVTEKEANYLVIEHLLDCCALL